MPNRTLFDFIQFSKEKNALPVVVSKKIHGILFPLFKQISVLGVNTYSTFVSRETHRKYLNFNKKYNVTGKFIKDQDQATRFFYEEMKYNEQLTPIDIKDGENTNSSSGLILKNFFERNLSTIAPSYHTNFIRTSFNYKGSFLNLIQSIGRGKPKNIILAWENTRAELIRSLVYGRLH